MIAQAPKFPEISVIIPAYNCRNYIRQAVMSVLSHSPEVETEVILVDDGSTDGTSEECDLLAQDYPEVRVIHQRNGGPSRARNAGIDLARGEYICFVDGDDMLAVGALERMREAIKQSAVSLLVCGFKKGRLEENETERLWKVEPITPHIYNWEELTEKALYQQVLVNTAWGALYRREEMFGDGTLRFREGILYEDLDFFYRAFHKAGRVAYTSTSVYFYRITPGSLTQKWSESRLDVLEVTADIILYMKREAPALVAAAEDRQFAACCNMLALALKYQLPEVQLSQIAARVWPIILSQRKSSLFSFRTRLKNRLGALGSFLPRPLFYFLLKHTSGA